MQNRINANSYFEQKCLQLFFGCLKIIAIMVNIAFIAILSMFTLIPTIPLFLSINIFLLKAMISTNVCWEKHREHRGRNLTQIALV